MTDGEWLNLWLVDANQEVVSQHKQFNGSIPKAIPNKPQSDPPHLCNVCASGGVMEYSNLFFVTMCSAFSCTVTAFTKFV